MPIKDLEKAREYKRLWIAKKRSRQNNVEPSPVVEPKHNNFVEPRHAEPLKGVEPCPRCPELEKQLEAVATLPTAYIDSREAEIKAQHQKEIERLQTKIKELEQPINPTIEL